MFLQLSVNALHVYMAPALPMGLVPVQKNGKEHSVTNVMLSCGVVISLITDCESKSLLVDIPLARWVTINYALLPLQKLVQWLVAV